MLDGLAGLGERVVDGVFDATGGRANQLDFLVRVVVSHSVLLRYEIQTSSDFWSYFWRLIRHGSSDLLHFLEPVQSQPTHATHHQCRRATMANTSLRKASLQSMEAEIESLLKSLESLKDDASDESRKTLKVLKSNAENALKHSRHLLSDAYEEVKVKTRETGIATRDYAQEHPWTTAGVAVGALGLLAAYLLCKRGD
jgi:ElaB/YqjD/DUF883 family membrane-anchored ribosome-binding protein